MTENTTFPIIVTLCSELAPVTAVLLFLAPLPTIYNVYTKQAVRDLPLLPYSSMVSNAFLWCTYGVLKHEPAVYVSNGVGLIMGSFYCAIYIKYSQDFPVAIEPPEMKPCSHKKSHFHLFGMALVVAVCLTIATATFLDVAVRREIIGIMGIVACVALFASPLAALQTVIEKKSAASIPLPFTVASGANCLMWTITGFFQMHDLNIIVPNTLGLFCALVQVALKIAYRETSGNGYCFCGTNMDIDDKLATLLEGSEGAVQTVV